VHADLRAKLGDFSFSASINDRTKDVPTAPFNTVFGLTGTSNRDQAFFAELGWEHELGAGVVADVRVSYDGRRHTSLLELTGTSTAPLGPDAGYAGSNDRVADWLDAEVRLRSPSLWGNRLYLGAEVQNAFRVQLNSFSPTSSLAGYAVSPPSDLSETVLSAYAGDDLELASWLRLSLAVRVDDHGASFGATANPRVAAILQPVAGGNLKLIYGTAYRAPSFYERYFTNGVSQLPGNRPSATGTPAVLQPETVRTGEFEYAQRLHEDFSVLVAGYWSRIEGILRLASFPGNPKLFAFGNRTTLTHSAGLEGEARWQPEPGLLVSAWYAWARVTNDSGSLVPNVPVHSAAVRLLLPVLGEALSFSTEAVYTSSRLTVRVDAKNVEVEVGEQLAWNVGLAGQAGRLRYGALVQNLLDNHPLEPAGLEVPFSPRAVPQPGRTLRLHVGGSF
jgi:outer membrane cobalamin receptor